MTRFLRILAAVLLLSLPAAAQNIVGPFTLAAVNDAVTIRALGTDLADVQFSFTGTATLTITWEMSLDGTNWVASPYAQRTDATTANPTIAATFAASGATPAAFFVPIPGNCLYMRGRVSAYTSGSLVGNARPGRPYVPGVPVVATLVEVSSVNVAYDSGILNVAGWSSVLVEGTSGVAAVLAVNSIHTDGTGTAALMSLSTAGAFEMLGSAPSAATSGAGLTSMRPDRIRIAYANAGATTTYVHATATR